MAEYICKSDILEEIEDSKMDFIGSPDEVASHNMMCDFAQYIIEDAIVADVIPVRHGRWIRKSNYDVCSNCGASTNAYTYGTKYCHNCGAKMDLEVEE